MARARQQGPVVLIILLGLLAASLGVLLAQQANDAGTGGTTPPPGDNGGCSYGLSKTVVIVDNAYGTDAYIALYYHSNGSLAGFEVRYDYDRPRPMAAGIGGIEARIDGVLLYDGPPVPSIDIPSQYEDGREHEITVVYKCR